MPPSELVELVLRPWVDEEEDWETGVCGEEGGVVCGLKVSHCCVLVDDLGAVDCIAMVCEVDDFGFLPGGGWGPKGMYRWNGYAAKSVLV